MKTEETNALEYERPRKRKVWNQQLPLKIWLPLLLFVALSFPAALMLEESRRSAAARARANAIRAAAAAAVAARQATTTQP